MQIRALVAARMPDLHHAPRVAFPVRFLDNARGDGDDRRAVRRGVIDAEVRAVVAVNRMEPRRRERRRDLWIELQRRAQELALERSAVLVEPRDLAVSAGIAD